MAKKILRHDFGLDELENEWKVMPSKEKDADKEKMFADANVKRFLEANGFFNNNIKFKIERLDRGGETYRIYYETDIEEVKIK